MKLFAPRITGPAQRLWAVSLVSLALLGGHTVAQAGHHKERRGLAWLAGTDKGGDV